MVILNPYGMTFDAVGSFDLVFWLLLKSCSSYCDPSKADDIVEFLNDKK